jgi:hypothetical protein
MPTPFDNAALYAPGSCGGYQQSLSGVLASGDFTNIATNNAADGVYTLNGNPVAIGDIIDLAHPNTVFDSVADIDAGGIGPHETTPDNFVDTLLVLKEPLLSQLIDNGFTLVVETFIPTTELSTGFTFNAYDDDFDPAAYAVCNTQYIECWSYDNESDLYVDDDLPTQNAVNKFAVTFTDARQAMSLNGGVVYSHEASGLGALTDLLDLAVPAAHPDTRLRSFAFYEPVDDADLPTLSIL